MADDGVMLAAALEYHGRGWSVLPLCPPDHVGVGKQHRGCRSPGKRPFFPDREAASGEWKEYQTRRATAEELERWWKVHPKLNLGLALGSVSELVGIDVDDDDGETILTELAGGDLPRTLEFTTGKGRRLLYRLPVGVTVANRSIKRKGTEIEVLKIMGDGTQTVAPPSVHPNGSVYQWKTLAGPSDLEPAHAPEWMRCVQVPEDQRPVQAGGGLIYEGGRNGYLTSVAGSMRKRALTEDAIRAALEVTNRERCVPPLEDRDVAGIARSVCRYAPDEFTGVTIRFGTAEPAPGPAGSDRRFKWSSELAAPPQSDDWIWDGYLPRGGVTLLSALWKAGKTTLLAHLLKALSGTGEFLGQPIRASKVLYISEEGERHWVRRRDALGLGDHAGFYLQPFGAKPCFSDWLAFVKQLEGDVREHGFDLIVFDTLAKLWPVTEENDAGEADAALMPLWGLTKAGAGVLLIHHLRKSGGSEYTGSRGSGALSAFPDIIVELTRFDATAPKDRKRVLRAKGRYEETPDELVIELGQDGYRHVPEPGLQPDGHTIQVPPAGREESAVLKVMAKNPDPWLTIEEIRDGLRAEQSGIRNKDLNTHIFSLIGRNQIVMRGTVRSKTDPRQYALSRRAPSGSAPGGVDGNEIWERDETDGDDGV